ncbi:membrane protein [Kitasatospora kazusensis]|uniref:Membrane protein n=1 Tax=Kitasatospora kazusensis TaxID=407974 RepID=A0ABP5KAZ4_9ACTN
MTEQSTPQPTPAGAPEPEAVRWFGTSWVERGSDYWLRRVLVPIGALAAAVAVAFVLRFGVDGVKVSNSGGFVYGLLLAAIAVCSCLAALRTWRLLAEGRDALTGWMADDKSLAAVWVIGCVGALVAYFVRSLTEAPGEAVARARYRKATERHARKAGRPGRPGGKPGKAGKRKG